MIDVAQGISPYSYVFHGVDLREQALSTVKSSWLTGQPDGVAVPTDLALPGRYVVRSGQVLSELGQVLRDFDCAKQVDVV